MNLRLAFRPYSDPLHGAGIRTGSQLQIKQSVYPLIFNIPKPGLAPIAGRSGGLRQTPRSEVRGCGSGLWSGFQELLVPG